MERKKERERKMRWMQWRDNACGAGPLSTEISEMKRREGGKRERERERRGRRMRERDRI